MRYSATTHLECTGSKVDWMKDGHYSIEKSPSAKFYSGWGLFIHQVSKGYGLHRISRPTNAPTPELAMDGFKTKKAVMSFLNENFTNIRKHIS